jgi:LDH2 family malate/lactate/ureidoglycolate dehydrogenase
MTELPIDEARDLAVAILRQHRLTEEDARIVADHLIDAQLTGYTFAGLPRLLVVLERLRAQDRTPEPIEVVRESPVSATVNGNGNLGYVVCRRAVDIAVDKAETSGLAVVGAYDSYYSGRSGYYVERAARRGMVAIHASSAFPMVAPTGGTRPVLGSNPIAMAFPVDAEQDPVIADLSTASSTWGALQLAKRVGEPLPEGIAIDAEGDPTTDPAAALLGAILPSAGHKGYAIAVAVQALGLFAGGDAVPEPFGNFGFFFLVMKRDLFVDERTYRLRTAEMVKAVQDAGTGSVVLPGQRGAQRRRAALARGVVEIPERVHQDLLALLDT